MKKFRITYTVSDNVSYTVSVYATDKETAREKFYNLYMKKNPKIKIISVSDNVLAILEGV